MPFLTDITGNDVVILKCDYAGCCLSKQEIRLRITKRTGNKVRLSIEADKSVKITKNDVRLKHHQNKRID